MIVYHCHSNGGFPTCPEGNRSVSVLEHEVTHERSEFLNVFAGDCVVETHSYATDRSMTLWRVGARYTKFINAYFACECIHIHSACETRVCEMRTHEDPNAQCVCALYIVSDGDCKSVCRYFIRPKMKGRSEIMEKTKVEVR